MIEPEYLELFSQILIPGVVSLAVGAVAGSITSAIKTEHRLTKLETLVTEIHEDVKTLLNRSYN